MKLSEQVNDTGTHPLKKLKWLECHERFSITRHEGQQHWANKSTGTSMTDRLYDFQQYSMHEQQPDGNVESICELLGFDPPRMYQPCLENSVTEFSC